MSDDQNPFYCPLVPAASFLADVREQVRRRDSAQGLQDRALSNTPELTRSYDEDSFPSFAKILDQSICEEDLLEMHYRPDHLRDPLNDDSSFLSMSSLHWQRQQPAPLFLPRAPRVLGDGLSGTGKNSPALPLTFSDFAVSPRRERSVIDVNEGSFELSAKAEKIRFFTDKCLDSPDEPNNRDAFSRLAFPESVEKLTSRVRALQGGPYSQPVFVRPNITDCMHSDQLYGLPVGTESPRGISVLISRLSTVLPGVRIRERLSAAGAETHQQITDTLASNGYLNTRILNILRTSEIEYLDIASSIGDENGLNLDSEDLFSVFSKPNSFLFLAEINLTGGSVKEADLLHLQHLPRLARLWLSSTGIGNEAIYYLTPLKRSLTDLDIAYNPKIDDDAIPPLLILSKLQYLTFHGTNVTILGVRRLAKTLRDQRRDMEVEVPRQCEDYISSAFFRCLSP
ncbi:hypothetical protein BC629DRAFT_1141943 [Irpex lacteus]|nr:hypothetical protein BC629DRAFT_1141943 [Irpex lacteus]